MWSLVAVVRTDALTGFFSSCRSACSISGVIVAEKQSVWRSTGTASVMKRDVLDEAHVEHAVGLVEHQRVGVVEVQLALLEAGP